MIQYSQRDLSCGSELDGTNDRVLILWPTILSHRIDEESPFYEMGPQEMAATHFELVRSNLEKDDE